MIGNLAFDLKTPMQALTMDLELATTLLQRPMSQTDECSVFSSRDVLRIASALENLTDTKNFIYMLMNRAMDFAKASSGQSLVPCLETINVISTIQWAIRVVQSKCTVPVILEPLTSDIFPHIITDKQWLIENILCLVSNAAKFTTAGSVTVRCELHIAINNLSPTNSQMTHDDESPDSQDSNHRADMLLIEVEDTGIGIPEEKRESMFQPFQQTMRMAGGTGLGLYSLRNRVEALKGTCGILGRRDGGSGVRAWFKIPYRPDTSVIDG